jgi:hypothetical protein
MTAHEIAMKLLKLPKDTVVCFNNGKGLWESVQTISCPESLQDIELEKKEQSSPSTWAFLNLKE